ncbi:MAG: hypothetical protein NZM25_02040 [Leptospiraceae bacterium]|nr:hypothetical protein [Leptospiraceae bacterium]MDW8306957.1 hypothetical protein [Leptospiraceae bacterium]
MKRYIIKIITVISFSLAYACATIRQDERGIVRTFGRLEDTVHSQA